MNADFVQAIIELGKEKGISPELLYHAVEEALITAYKKNFGLWKDDFQSMASYRSPVPHSTLYFPFVNESYPAP